MGAKDRYLSLGLTAFVLAVLLFTGQASALLISLGSFSDSNPIQGDKITISTTIQVNSERVNDAVILIDGNDYCTFNIDTAASNCTGMTVSVISKNTTYGYGYGYGYGFGNGTNEYNITIDTAYFTASKHSLAVKVDSAVSSSIGFSITAPVSVPEGQSITNTTYVDVYDDWNISLPLGSSVSLSGDTVITTADGLPMDFTQFNFADINLSSLSNINDVEGGFHFGITNLGLEFSIPVKLSIYVGTSLNGKNLKLYRAIDGSHWTQDGLDPKQCTVVDGLCNFTTTKASYFAAATTPTPHGGNGGGRSSHGQEVSGKNDTYKTPQYNITSPIPKKNITTDDKKNITNKTDKNKPMVLAEESTSDDQLTGNAVGRNNLGTSISILILMIFIIFMLGLYLYYHHKEQDKQ